MNAVNNVGFIEHYFPRVYAFFQKVKQIFLCCAGNDDARKVDAVGREALSAGLLAKADEVSFDQLHEETLRRLEPVRPEVSFDDVYRYALSRISPDSVSITIEDDSEAEEESVIAELPDPPSTTEEPSTTEVDSDSSDEYELLEDVQSSRVSIPEDDEKELSMQEQLYFAVVNSAGPEVANTILKKVLGYTQDEVIIQKINDKMYQITLPEEITKAFSTEATFDLTDQEKSLINDATLKVAKELYFTFDGNTIFFAPKTFTVTKKIGSGFFSKTVSADLLSISKDPSYQYVTLGIENILENHSTINWILKKAGLLDNLSLTEKGYIPCNFSTADFMSFFQ